MYVVCSKPFIRTVCNKTNHLTELHTTFHCRYGTYTTLKICIYVVHSIPPGGSVCG